MEKNVLNLNLKRSNDRTISSHEIETLISCLYRWAVTPELDISNKKDGRIGYTEYKLDIYSGVCSNLKKNLSSLTLDDLSSRYLLCELGIDPTTWSGWLPGISEEEYPIAGKEEYLNYMPKWLLDTCGKRRRDFCVWVAEQLEIKLSQGEL